MCSPDGGRQNKFHFTTMPCPRSPRLVKTEHNAVCSAPRVGNSRPSLKGRQVAALVADNAASRAQEEASRTTLSNHPSGGAVLNWSPLHTRQWADSKCILRFVALFSIPNSALVSLVGLADGQPGSPSVL